MSAVPTNAPAAPAVKKPIGKAGSGGQKVVMTRSRAVTSKNHDRRTVKRDVRSIHRGTTKKDQSRREFSSNQNSGKKGHRKAAKNRNAKKKEVEKRKKRAASK
jgi:hypothetical protein